MKFWVIPFLKRTISVWIPLAVTVTAIVLTIVIGRTLQRQEEILIKQTTETEAIELRWEIESGINELLQEFTRAAERWNRREGGTPYAEWKDDAAQYAKHFAEFRSFERIDRDLKTQWVFSPASAEPVFKESDSATLHRRLAFESAHTSHKTVVSRLIPLTEGGNGFFICAPVYQNSKFDGFLVGVFRLQSVFEKLIPQQTRNNYSVLISENGEPIFLHDWKGEAAPAEAQGDVGIAGLDWKLRLEPKSHTALLQRSTVDETAVAGGLIMSVLLGLLTSFSLQMNWQARSLRAVNEVMIHEIERSEKATERQKEIEEALRRSESLFRVLTTNSPVGIFQTDVSGDCLFVNERWTELTGMSLQRAQGKGWVENLHAEDRDLVFREWYEAAQSGNEFSCEYRFHPRGEITIWVAGRAVALRDNNHQITGYIGAITDITKSKIIEQSNRRLIKKLENLKFALDQSAIVAIMNKSGEINYVNDKFCEISGYARAELIGETHIFDGNYNSAESGGDIWETIRGGKVWKGEVENRRKDDSIYWVDTTIVPFLDEKNEPFQYISIRTDITDRKLAEGALRESEDKFRAFMDSTPAVAYMKDEEGYYHFGNKLMTDVFQVTTESLKGKRDYDLLPESIANNLRASDLKILQSGESAELVETVLTSKGENRFWLTLKFPFINRTGQKFVGGVAVDITDRQQAEENLAQSLVEKEILLKEVHHRVKNNLQIISSLLNMQIRRLSDAASVQQLTDVKQRVLTMSLIHEKLYKSDDFTNIDLGAYLKNLAEMVFQTYKNKTPHISLRHKCELININVEKALSCGLIVNELISNSLKYAFSESERGSIWILLSTTDERCARLEIGDDGSGLAAHFEPEKAQTLGLKLVNSLVQQLDAKLEIVRSGGTVFKVTFDY